MKTASEAGDGDPRRIIALLVRDLPGFAGDLRTLPEELRSFADDLRLLIEELR